MSIEGATALVTGGNRGMADPNDIARAGLVTAHHDIAEHDTDPFAIGVRASLARDPSGLAAALAAGLRPR